MKNILITLIVLLSISCKKEKQEPFKLEDIYYKNLYTGQILNKAEFKHFSNSILRKHLDSTQLAIDSDLIKKANLIFHFYEQEKSTDSVIQEFKYDIRVGDKYLIRAKKYDKIGMNIPPQTFNTINGEKFILGGKQEKPTLINLWFINCRGCMKEIPALNRLKEKYSDKVNFVSLTFEKENDVLKFLNSKEFNFIHIANVRGFIEKIGSYPYPENIFIDKNGYITNIEGGLPAHKDLDVDTSIEYFESIIKKLL